MCKYFAMGGCNRTDCPFSHELTVEATSHHEAASGFVLSGNVANIRNARAGSPKEVYGSRTSGMGDSDGHHSPYMSWNNSSPTLPGMGSHGTTPSSSHGAGFDDGHAPSSRTNSTGGAGFSGNMGNDSQMLSLLLGGGPGPAPGAGAAGANPRVGIASSGEGGAAGATSTVSNSSFDVSTINRPAEFTPYPAPNSMSQHSHSHSHSHNHSSHSGSQMGYGHHGRGHGMHHHSSHSHHHEDFLSSGELQQRYLTNNNVAALFGAPAPSMLSSTSNGNPALSALLGQAPTSFTAYPATKPGAAFPPLGSSVGSSTSNQATLQDGVHLPGNGSLTAIPGGASTIAMGGSTTSETPLPGAPHNSTVSPVVGPMHAPSSSTSSTSGTAGGYNPFSGVSPTIMPMAAPTVQLPPAPTMTAASATAPASSAAVAAAPAAPPTQPQPHPQPQVAPAPQHSAVQHTPAAASGPTAAEKLHTPRTQPSGLPIPSADLFPPLPSTAPSTSGATATVKHDPPVVHHAPHSYIAKLTGAGRSSTPPSEGIGASAHGLDPNKERVPKVPVSIDDEMSALQSMHYRSPDGSKESPSAPGKREEGSEHPPPREVPQPRERGMGAPRGGKDYRSVAAANSNNQARPDREREKPQEREPAPRPDIPAPKSAAARGGANAGGRGQGHDRGGYHRRQNDAPTNAPVPL
jgi:hypothetical protein